MGCWSPTDAMKAYMHALKLCKDQYNQDGVPNRPYKLIEPECMEFISALAAGNQARLMVDITSGGLSTSTLALAIAATHVGGRLVCVRHESEAIEEIKAKLEALDLEHVAELRVGDPCEVMKRYENIDFAVVDHRIKECVELLFAMEMNPSSGSVVVVSNLFHGGRSVRSCTAFGQMMRSAGHKSAVLPIGDGMEITRFTGNINGGRRGVRRSCKRTFMVYDEICPPKFCGGGAKDVGIIMSS